MNIPAFSINNYRLTVMAFLTLLILGIASFQNMPRSEDPVMDMPNILTIAIYPGANPTDIERQVADPIEEAINELEDIKEMKTTIRDGVMVIMTEFDYGVNVGDKEEEIQRQINSIKGELPRELYDLTVEKFTTANVKVFQIALVSSVLPYQKMKNEGERLKKIIEKVKGVRNIEIEAYPEQQVRIALNPVKMAEMNISLDDVENAIKSNNANIPGGAVKISNKLFNVKTSGSYDNLSQIENTVVGAYMGKIIYLKNIAAVFFDYEEERWLARFNGDRSIYINIEAKPGINIFTMADPIKKRLADIEMREGIRMEYVFDQSAGVEERINGFLSNLLQGILLVGIIIFLILGYRSASIVMMAIPLSILIGLWAVDSLGYGLQQISIAGLVVALGLLVDNSIAIIENIERFIVMGYSRKEAAIKGTQQLIAPMASATLTTVMAFVPMIMMPDATGAFIRGIPVTVITTLIASLIVATTLTPFVASKVLRKNSGRKPKSDNVNLAITTNRTGTTGFRVLKSFVEGPYRKALNWAINHKILSFSFAGLSLIGSLALFPLVGISFFPKAEKPQFRITVELPNGSNLDATDEAITYIESILGSKEEVSYYASNIGHGNPMIYYNVPSRNFSESFAELFVVLKSYDVDEFKIFLDDLRNEFDTYSGARIDVREFVQGPPSPAPIEVKIFGEQLNKLETYAQEVENIVQNTPGIYNVNNPTSTKSTDLYFDINRDKATMLGVPIHIIDKTIRSFVAGSAIARFRDKDAEDYDIVMRYDYEDRFKLEDFDKIKVKSYSGKFIPLRHLANIEFKEAPSQISHYNMERTATVLADFQDNAYTLDDRITAIDEQMKQLNWEEGYSYMYMGDLENRNKSFGGLGIASALAMLFILGILVIQFKSFSQPLIIFSALPLAIIGSILALLLTGHKFSFTSFVGFTSLIGIAINNSIILVDFANTLRDEGASILEAAKQAAEVRFIPILLTTLTTILGLLPLTLNGGSLWAPMGWVIIGGLLTSTFFVLLLVPILYEVFTKKKR
ncbi:MAG: efflux RND transporter permease subunit [Bacteroidetes bacterium]|nr:efflux RND transporter permease subunit [Bacteroidota bacterium]